MSNKTTTNLFSRGIVRDPIMEQYNKVKEMRKEEIGYRSVDKDKYFNNQVTIGYVSSLRSLVDTYLMSAWDSYSLALMLKPRCEDILDRIGNDKRFRNIFKSNKYISEMLSNELELENTLDSVYTYLYGDNMEKIDILRFVSRYTTNSILSYLFSDKIIDEIGVNIAYKLYQLDREIKLNNDREKINTLLEDNDVRNFLVNYRLPDIFKLEVRGNYYYNSLSILSLLKA